MSFDISTLLFIFFDAILLVAYLQLRNFRKKVEQKNCSLYGLVNALNIFDDKIRGGKHKC